MSGQQMVADDHTIINPQGIRFVEKIDQATFASLRYRLRVTYKGQELDFTYPDEATRNGQYEALRSVVSNLSASSRR